MRKQHLFVLLGFLSLGIPELVPQQVESPSPTVASGKDGVFAAFQNHPVVALGDVHGMAQEEDFFAEAIRDPRFAKNVESFIPSLRVLVTPPISVGYRGRLLRILLADKPL